MIATVEERETDARKAVRWIKATPAAERLGVHRRTLIRWCERGLVPAKKTPGGQWILPEWWVEEQGYIGPGDTP